MAVMSWGSLSAQSYWARDVGGPGNDHVADVKTDDAGNIYATGEFSGMIQFGGATYTSTGGIDMFLTKMSPTGQVLWFVQGGGPGIDRGIKLAVRGVHVAVVGAFMNTANFQGQAITSAGGPDIFLAMHDAATGNLQWIAQGGGPLASDRPYGVTIAGSGNVTMVGEFSGTVSIGGATLTSMTDPQNMTASVDVFIATYSPAGAPLWTRQGSAKHTDRAIDVVNDLTDNIYVTGQFSDTIQFVSMHPNVMYNATFLLKLDPVGNEVWFRRLGGAVYNQVRDMQWTSANDLLMVGDLQGTMIFLDSAPTQIASGAPYAYYLLRVDSAGQLLTDVVVNSSNPVSGRAIDERGGTVTVLGQFECQFTSRVDSAHAGLWMATGMQDLFIIRHELDSLYVKDAQQFGGRQEKLAGQVATLNDGSAIFCGSYEDVIVFPSNNEFSADLASYGAPYGLSAPNTMGYCNDPSYGYFAADTSNGLKDGFIARGYVLGRAAYDWWVRDDTSCTYLPRALCIGPGEMAQYCSDTLEFCGHGLIGILPEFSFHIDGRKFFVGPDLDFLWSTGATTDSLKVTTTGMYSVTCTSANGCLQWTDSVYVIIHPIPPQPLLSDDVIVGTDSSVPYHINICDPTEVWLWCSNVDTTTNYSWIGPDGTPVASDSLLVDTTGTYTFRMQSAFGCASVNYLMVHDHPSLSIPDVTVSLQIVYPQDADHNDTLDLCPTQARMVNVVPTWELNGAPYTFPYTNPPDMYFGFVMNGDTIVYGQPYFSIGYPAYVPGWYADEVSIFVLNKPCGADTLFLPTVTVDSVYVRLFPAVSINVGLTGPSVICPSDTALLVADCANCDAIIWHGGGIVSTSGDSAYVLGGSTYTAYGSVTDTTGCAFSDYAQLQVSFPGVPELDVFPPDGIICPDSIAIIYTHALGSYTWYGPEGEIAINNDSILVTIPGEYYLALVDPNGCYLISDPILITGYSTPFLNVMPDGVLCTGEDPVVLQVVTTGYSSLAWAAPLSGNSLVQSIDQPGVYSCTVQACGITTELSTEIIAGGAVAEVLDPGPFTICPGDTVALVAAGGQAVYFWNPGPIYGDSLLVTQAGDYTLITLDANGCSDTAEVVVLGHAFGGPLTIADQTVCSGTPVSLTETATGNFNWYADNALTVLLGSGPTLDLGIPTDSSTVYLVRSDSVCTGQPVPVNVDVVEPPAVTILSAPDTLCAGDTALFIAGPGAPFDLVWTTPAGPGQGDTLLMGPLTAANGGWYAVVATSSGCTGLADSTLLTIVTPASINLGPDTAMCPGNALVYNVPPGFTGPIWQQGIAGTSYTADQTGTVTLEAIDMHGCAVRDTVMITILAPDQPATASDITLCFGQDAMIAAGGSGTLSWYADAGLTTLLGTGSSLLIPSPADSITIYLVQDQFGCEGPPLAIAVNVVQTPVNVTLDGPDHFCEQASGSITASGPPGMEGSWSTPSGPYGGTVLEFASVQQGDSGWYILLPSVAGCIGTADSIHMAVLVPVPIDLGPDTTFCEGAQFTLSMPPGFTEPVWSTGGTGFAITVTAGGTFGVDAMDVNGCPSNASIILGVLDCPSIAPNVITPNGDGINDGFTLGDVGAVSGELVIYDRWGALIHTGDPVAKTWKGTIDKTGEPAPEGVYYYVLRLLDSAGAATEMNGYFSIFR
ncbi:MAG: gliding motility-associated C-terminal domain-containing protein [Flavobacteriales bacterium]